MAAPVDIAGLGRPTPDGTGRDQARTLCGRVLDGHRGSRDAQRQAETANQPARKGIHDKIKMHENEINSSSQGARGDLGPSTR